jgi:glutaredoxin 3
MNQIEIYSTDNCPWCTRAKSLLRTKGLDFKEIDISSDHARALEMIVRSGRRTVPQIFIDDQPIGGFDELSKMNL